MAYGYSLVIISLTFQACVSTSLISFDPNSVELSIEELKELTISIEPPVNESFTVYFNYNKNDTFVQDVEIVHPLQNLTIPSGTKSISINVTGAKAGTTSIGIYSDQSIVDSDAAVLRVSVVHNHALVVVIAVIGWIYFAAWSISFYPQVYENWKRKSVIGLNFDFLAYNITGFLAYGVFNVGLFWIDDVKRQYFEQHPRGVNPVQLNDVIFTLHAIFVTAVTITQAIIYEKGGQKVSKICMVLVGAAWLFALVTLLVAAVWHKITWLTYLYFFSYIKLGITLIKYIPQAWMNYKRKSTSGWSIGNVLLDLTGGSFSLLQMFLISYNSDDWGSIFGDPTKFGLGFFSILFDILFIVQHYCLYKHTSGYTNINEEDA